MTAKLNTTIAYTDGACKGNPGAGGWGAYLIFADGTTQELYAGEADTTNNRMEMMATIQAILHSPAEHLLEIWTDSSYVKNGITKWVEGWKKNGWKTASKKAVKNQELWQQLDELNQSRNISWHWIKGHAGHEGNEKADELANQGVIEPDGNLHLIKKKDSNKQHNDMTTQSTEVQNNSTNANGTHLMSEKLDNEANEPEELIEFDGDTSRANPYFRPLLPTPINQGKSNRQLIMDTETTGFEYNNGDRVIEIGIVEMVGRKFTGEKLHVYINPNRKEAMSEEVIRVHGITDAFLADKPTFDKIAQPVYDFMVGAEIIAHNASFDMNFLNMEFDKVGLGDFKDKVKVTDSLVIAKDKYPGQRNTLDALVRRLNVGKQDRTFHGALLDSEILAEVYLAMTGGQVALAIDEDSGDNGHGEHQQFAELAKLLVADKSDDDNHKQWLSKLENKFPKLSEVWG